MDAPKRAGGTVQLTFENVSSSVHQMDIVSNIRKLIFIGVKFDDSVSTREIDGRFQWQRRAVFCEDRR